MKRIIILLFAALIAVFSGCGKNENVSSNDETIRDAKIEELKREQAEFDGTLAACEKDGKWGYISKDGSFYINPQFVSAGNFSFGAAAVSVNDKEKGEIFGYIAVTGKYIDYLHPSFKTASAFSKEGIARVTENSSDYFYINKEGTLAFNSRIIDYGEGYYEEYINAFNYASDFKNGYALVGENNPNTNELEYFVISDKGEVSLKFDKKYFSDDIFAIAYSQPDENGYCIAAQNIEGKLKFGVIDLSGNTLVPFKYEEILPMSDKLFAVKLSGKWGFCDENGEVIIDYKYADATSFENGSAAVSNGKKWGIIDKEGKWILKPAFDAVSENGFSEGIISYKKKDKWGYVSYKGEIITEAVFKEAFDFSAGAAKFSDANGLFGFINKNGAVIIEPGFINVQDFNYIG